MTSKANAISWPCPACESNIGDSCVPRRGESLYGSVHRARRDLTEAWQEGYDAGKRATENDSTLAAAAPDLLSACESALHELREYCPNVCGDAIDACEAAIKKARTK